jgi:ABC-2 type transport system permease protein
MIAQPLSTVELAVGLTGAGYLLAAVRVMLYLAVAIIALGVAAPQADPLGVLVAVVVGCAAFMCIGIALLALGVAFRRGEALGRVALFGLTFLSGAYFPVSRLPGALRAVADVLPPTLALDALRAALFGGGGYWADIGWLVLSVAVMFPLALLALDSAVAWMTARGTLTGS